MKKKRGSDTCLAKARNSFYYAVAHGGRLYTNKDGAEDYKNNSIKDPKQSTYTNLFVNGVIQPAQLYSVRKGMLIFKSEDPPQKGTPIILQFVDIYFKRKRVTKRTRRKIRGKRIKYEE